jgi:hypothetical protein
MRQKKTPPGKQLNLAKGYNYTHAAIILEMYKTSDLFPPRQRCSLS